MLIEDVKLTVFRRPSDGNEATMIKGQDIANLHAEVVAVQVIDSDGRVGESLSMGGGMGLAHYIAATVKPLLIGRDPAQREAIWQDLWDLDRLWFSPLFTIGTMDTAVWDLYGKQKDAPIHEILGTYRTKLPTYASSLTHDTVDGFVQEALEYQKRGFHAYKIHVLGQPDFDIECCRAVRAAVGDDYKLMVDAVAGYNQVEALRVGYVLDELAFHWYEEPLRDYDLIGYKMLADKLRTPIAGTETNEGGLVARAEFIASRAVGIVRADPSLTYGIGHTKKIGALAEAFGMNLEVHTNPNPMMDAAALQVACSLRNTEFFELLVPREAFDFGVKEPVFVDDEGYAHAPDKPGLGLEIDWDFVNDNAIAEL